ncbi:hypothetical protein AKJ16_DCAP09041 [Drosera capensis]
MEVVSGLIQSHIFLILKSDESPTTDSPICSSGNFSAGGRRHRLFSSSVYYVWFFVVRCFTM